jgi:GTPase Era involved in 16S rRNA processing
MVSRNKFSQQDRIVVLLGHPGAGKSTFIDYAIKGKGEGPGIGHGMPNPHTREFEAFSYPHPTDGYPVVFVDTPGFDEEFMSATSVLAELGDWLKKKYKGHVDVAVVIYLHKINANRMTGSLMKSLQSLKEIQAAIPHVVIATTMWSEVKERTVAEAREDQLKNDFWTDLEEKGCRIERFEETYKSAWDIVGNLAVKAQVQSNQSTPKKFTERILSLFKRS